MTLHRSTLDKYSQQTAKPALGLFSKVTQNLFSLGRSRPTIYRLKHPTVISNTPDQRRPDRFSLLALPSAPAPFLRFQGIYQSYLK